MINILGAQYKIENDTSSAMDNYDGVCDRDAKIITTNFDDDRKADERCTKNYEEFKHRILRHEIMHAVFHECGLSKYAEDEILVELLAIQFPKIVAAMKEGDTL